MLPRIACLAGQLSPFDLPGVRQKMEAMPCVLRFANDLFPSLILSQPSCKGAAKKGQAIAKINVVGSVHRQNTLEY
jgi:hypothetical protein